MIICAALNVRAQDTLVTAQKTATHFTEKDIIIDSSDLEVLHSPTGFKKHYESAAFEYEKKSHEKNWWERFKEWLVDIVKRLFSFSNNESSLAFIKIAFYCLIALALIFVTYLIVKLLMNKDGQWIFGRNSDKKILHYDEIERNLQLVDFEKLIKETLESGENRLTIRYYYLWLLKKMCEKEIIEWDAEKTNTDYLYEIKSENLKNDFTYLSYLYNYIWYGEFEIDQDEFEKAKAVFEKTIKTL